MSAPHDPAPIPEPLRERAAAWRVRLHADTADEADWLAFEAWLAESAAHRRAYDAVEAAWAALDDAPLHARRVPAAAVRRRALGPAAWIGAIAACLVAALAVGFTAWRSSPRTQILQTAPGERRVVALADGTRLTLNGGSRLTVTLGRGERRVVMAQAEAVFDVAKDRARPFLIRAGDREIRVVGTEFDVLRHAGQVQVTVRRGIVEVRPAEAPGQPPLARLSKGQALSHVEGAADDRVTPADPAAALSWTEGRLVFQGETLAEVARTLNRYVATPIEVAPEARDLPVRAVLVLGPEDQMLQTLAAFLPVRSERRPDHVRLSLRRVVR